MGKKAKKMIRRCIDAYVTLDVDLAAAIIQRDEKIDKKYHHLFTTLMSTQEEIDAEKEEGQPAILIPASRLHATYLLWVGHYLERMGDRAVNIAERVIYITENRFVEAGTFDLDDHGLPNLKTQPPDSKILGE